MLEQVVNFRSSRQEVLADNISNFDTVGYKMKDLDTETFFANLDKAVEKRSHRGVGAPLDMRSSRNLSWDRQGRMEARKIPLRDNNILFHDRNNRSVEKQMSQMAKNFMQFNIARELLTQQYGQLKMAIRGKL